MARPQTPPLLSQIRVARSYSEQATALRALRDELVGHIQRKERWIQNGILEPLVEILQDDVRSPTRLIGKEPSQTGQPGFLSDHEMVRLLCLQLIASFAYGGAAFLAPIHAAGVVPAVMSVISPADNSRQVVLAALRALSNITASAELTPIGGGYTSRLSDALFSSGPVDALRTILFHGSLDSMVQEQKCLVAGLISRLCKSPRHQNALADAGILDSLATMLASFVVSRGEVVPGAELAGQTNGLARLRPAPAPPGADLALVLEALSTIVADSRFRSCYLLSSPAIMSVFPSVEFMPPATESRAAWNALEANGFGDLGTKNPGAIDYLLPAVPVPKLYSRGRNEYPPLGFSQSRDALAGSGRSSTFKFTGIDLGRLDVSSEEEDDDEPESPLIPWLIHLVRSTDGLERVMAAALLTSLFKSGFAVPEREQALAFLVIPLLCQLLKEHDKEVPASVQQAAFVEPDTATQWAIQERTLDVLARLVGDSEVLQQAAYDCGIIKMVAKLLKDSYEPHPVQSAPRPWSPEPEQTNDFEQGLATCRLGPPGQLPATAHKIRMRESALKLVTAMATLSKDYREALVEADIVPYIVESLSTFPGKPKSPKEQPASEKGRDGGDAGGASPYGPNLNAVIMAACHATRALARLPSIVRTTLQDHGIAMPINKLLRHPAAEVQIAASSAVINLLTNCSPMVEPLLDAGVVKTLCEHAHSLNPGLQLNALWALKHLVVNLDNNLRKQCLEELEPGWLVQLISDDASEDEAFRAQARPERRVTTTNPADEEDEDMENTENLYEDDSSQSWIWPAMSLIPPAAAAGSRRLQQVSLKLGLLREAELSPARKCRADTIAIQEQGLGFIRNLLMLPTPASQTDMVDYLFTELGQDRLFGILADKLKVRVVGAFGRRGRSAAGTARGGGGGGGGGNDTLVVYPQPRIVENLTYILVHMAAGVPRHRQLVVAQTELLRLLGGHFNSKDAGVRRALCQLFVNLSFLEGEADRGACSQRALELERLGFVAKLEGLERGDGDLDVRERAKAAVAQLKTPTV
ncbi:ARM repeat-containing protein [Parathielavia hyrcaniae]|uniref:ARM repeat-containing protein n=1 Tax=Parathielavia hyrcaniae TaxID=113614 RepID=A0AAN6Q302_9PEZI|nr:ARM repeat-containing protein [Parathielavia hyrcaniae]